jgi:NADH-quinone oxidoreductase subunit G
MVNIEIDGIPLTVDSSKMIIQAADEAGIDIPRFCYHKKLSIAANCRMCLVEVDRARKALPACATPVTEGMKVFTQSEVALSAQRGVMEFLLINHPLDCPICDQGGECELQDLSVGYGQGVGRFSEQKRVVKEKNIGPLIQTDMTRCIHCTRCVRFGQEIAGIKELGATGRGEHMEIGTYVEHSLASELSGNIIDLCPVGALTSKPFRYKARAWELTAHANIARHDAVGSNIEYHTSKGKVLRVVPRDNETINETWISDRDRFAYLGYHHEERALEPMIKRNGVWETTDWETALGAAIDGLKVIRTKHGADQIAGLISPTATLEEGFLFQKLMRGIGTDHIDYRLRQQDFSDDSEIYSDSNWRLQDIQDADAILLVGSNIRHEQPMIAHRIRQAAMHGTTVCSINLIDTDLLMPVEKQLTVNAEALVKTLAGIAKALLALKAHDGEWDALLELVTPSAEEQTLALQLSNAMNKLIFVGALAQNHPYASQYKALSRLIADLCGAELLVLEESNSQAMRLAGIRRNAVEATSALNAITCFEKSLRGYLLFGVEPELDCADAQLAGDALHQASFVVSINSFMTENMKAYSDVILPLAGFAETSGTFINIEHQWQSFTGSINALGNSRPGWKILRVLGNVAKLNEFDYVSSQDICEELREAAENQQIAKPSSKVLDTLSLNTPSLRLISEVPMYLTDSVVRRSHALNATLTPLSARMNSHTAAKWNLSDCQTVEITLNDARLTTDLTLDDAISDDSIYLPAGYVASGKLGLAFSEVSVKSTEGANHD